MPPEVALELGPLSLPIWEVWELLSGARRWSRGMEGALPEPIPVSELLAAAPLAGQPAALVVPLLRTLDDIWLADTTTRLSRAPTKGAK